MGITLKFGFSVVQFIPLNFPVFRVASYRILDKDAFRITFQNTQILSLVNGLGGFSIFIETIFSCRQQFSGSVWKNAWKFKSNHWLKNQLALLCVFECVPNFTDCYRKKVKSFWMWNLYQKLFGKTCIWYTTEYEHSNFYWCTQYHHHWHIKHTSAQNEWMHIWNLV